MCITLALSRSIPARPYIDRLIAFSRFTWPSTGPLLHGPLNADDTAVSSACNPAANPANSGTPPAAAFPIQSASGVVTVRRIMPANSPARSRAASNPGTRPRTRSRNDGPSASALALGPANWNDGFWADGISGAGVGRATAGGRRPGFPALPSHRVAYRRTASYDARHSFARSTRASDVFRRSSSLAIEPAQPVSPTGPASCPGYGSRRSAVDRPAAPNAIRARSRGRVARFPNPGFGSGRSAAWAVPGMVRGLGPTAKRGRGADGRFADPRCTGRRPLVGFSRPRRTGRAAQVSDLFGHRGRSGWW